MQRVTDRTSAPAHRTAAYEAKMRAQLPTSKCCLCGEAFKGYGHNGQRPPRARRGRGVRRVQRGDRAAPALPQVGAVSIGADRSATGGPLALYETFEFFLEEICQLLHGLLDELLGNIGVFYLLVYTLIYYQLNL